MLREQIQNDLKESMKSKNEMTSLVLRSLISAIRNKEIELNKREEGLNSGEIEAIILSEIKKRKEAEMQFEKGGRDELAAQEKDEAEILQKYAPEQLSQSELESIVDGIIKTTGAAGMQDVGKVMKEVMQKVGNKADGSSVSALVREKLQ